MKVVVVCAGDGGYGVRMTIMDNNTVHCFYPDFEVTHKSLLQVVPFLQVGFS